MSTLEISGLEENSDGQTRFLSANFGWPRGRKIVRFSTNAEAINSTMEPFLPVALIPAMRRGWALRLDGIISHPLLEGANEIQEVMSGWYRSFRPVPIEARVEPSGQAGRERPAAAFFSGGVDSFFTLKQHAGELDSLVFVHGFDLPLNARERRTRMAENARRVAEEMDLRFIEVETNLRDFGDPIVSWLDAYFGAGLAAVALLLAPMFSRVYIPASVSTEQLIPLGSHPDLDRHWSNGELELVHDAAEHNRFEKIRALADWPLAGEHLRVCYQSIDEGLNCGRCRKCLWTMLVLESMGRLEEFSTFPPAIDLKALEAFLPTLQDERDRFVNAIQILEERNANPELKRTLQRMLELGERVRPENWLKRTVKRLGRSVRKRILPKTLQR